MSAGKTTMKLNLFRMSMTFFLAMTAGAFADPPDISEPHPLRGIEAEYEHVVEFGRWARFALAERMVASDKTISTWSHSSIVSLIQPAAMTQAYALSQIKDKLRWQIVKFVDHTVAPSGDFTDWFNSPIGTNEFGVNIYPENFPMHSISQLLYRIGAPTNYFDYTPSWRPLDTNLTGYVTNNMLPGYTSIDYGWKHIRPILTNLLWTADTSCNITGQVISVEEAGGKRDYDNWMLPYYGTRTVDPDGGWHDNFTIDRWPTQYTSTASGCLQVEVYRYNFKTELNTTYSYSGCPESDSGYKTWIDDYYMDRDVLITSDGTLKLCYSQMNPSTARVHLVRSGVMTNLSVFTSASAYAEGCSSNVVDYSITNRWNTADGASRCAVIADVVIGSGSNICASLPVTMSPPSLGAITPHTVSAHAYAAVGPCGTGCVRSASEERELTRTVQHYKATGKAAILLMHQFNY